MNLKAEEIECIKHLIRAEKRSLRRELSQGIYKGEAERAAREEHRELEELLVKVNKG